MEPEEAELATRRLMEAELEAMAHYSYKQRKAEKTEAAVGAEKTRATRHRHFIGSIRQACIPVGVSAFPGPSAKERTVEEETKARTTATISGWRPRRTRSWLSLPFFGSSFPRRDGYAPLDELEEGTFRSVLPGRSEQLALDHKLVMDCLELYSSLHPGDEYEPAPGTLTKHSSFGYRSCWTHGNFVARRKSSGCFSFLPAPRTLFFFELVTNEDFDGVVTCIPLDEPVEAYSFLGFPLGWRSRRDGSADHICKTCYRCFEVPRNGPRKTFPCGHDKSKVLCQMCYLMSCVLHPHPEEFAYGHSKN